MGFSVASLAADVWSWGEKEARWGEFSWFNIDLSLTPSISESGVSVYPLQRF